MDELELMRAVADEMPLPELRELGEARAALIRAIASEHTSLHDPPPRRPAATRGPRRRQLVIGAAVSAATAGVASFGLLSLHEARSGVSGVRSVASARVRRLPPLAHPTATQVLDRAALVALHAATATPSGDQFVYTKTEDLGGETIQSWLSVDGTRTSRVGTHSIVGCVNGQMSLQMLGTAPTDGRTVTRTCAAQPAYFPDMPRQASGMLPYLERTQGVRPGDVNDIAKTVGELLNSDYLLPAQQSALYEFLARTPGITVQTGVSDAAGRAGVGVAWSFDASQAMIIFDSRTYTYLGMRTRGIHGQLGGTALLATAIVDRVGQLPESGATAAPADRA